MTECPECDETLEEGNFIENTVNGYRTEVYCPKCDFVVEAKFEEER